MQVWSKSVHSFKRQGADKPFFNNLSPCVTLKMGSRSPKSNQFFFMSQQYSFASLVKIHPFLHEIGCRQDIFQQSKPLCLFVLRFYGPVNPMGSCRARSVYLTTHLLGRLSPLSGLPVLCTFFRQKLTTALLESAEGRE